MAKKIIKNPNDFEPIVVNGCLIEPNTIYEVVAKTAPDSAPPIYHELGSTKERMPGVSNTATLTQMDTGFFSASPIFTKYDSIKNDWVRREEIAQEYFDIFAAPLKMYISEIERIRIPSDNEFFDRNYPQGYFTVNVGEGIQFNTASPIDRFKLYVAIIEGELCMKGKRTDEEREAGLKDEMDMFHQDAQYALVSITERKSRKEEQDEVEMEAAYRYSDLLRTDKELLIDMLMYINIPVKKDFSKAELLSIFKTKIEPNTAKLKEFVEILKDFDDRPTQLKSELELLEKLKTKKGRELVIRHNSTYIFNDVTLGSNLKSVVATFMKRENEELLKQFYFNFE
jgi:hypothetical protein